MRHARRRRLLGTLVREARLKAGISQTALAEALGRSRSYIGRLESGAARLTAEEFIVLCRHLKISPATLARRLDGGR